MKTNNNNDDDNNNYDIDDDDNDDDDDKDSPDSTTLSSVDPLAADWNLNSHFSAFPKDAKFSAILDIYRSRSPSADNFKYFGRTI